MKPHRILPFCFLAFSLFGCIFGNKTNSGDSSRVAHNPGEPTRGIHPSQWAVFSFQEVEDVFAYDPDSKWYPMNHPATVRLQWWANSVDAYLREKYPEKMQGVPKPFIVLSRSPSINGAAKSAPLCFPIKFEMGHPGEVSTHRAFLNVYGPEIVEYDSRSETKCRNSQSLDDAKFLLGRFNDANAATGNPCRITLEASGFRVGTQCTFNTYFTSAPAAGILVQANVIELNAGIVQKMGEAEALATLAHELGHFYKADISRPVGDRTFLYEIGPENHDKKPIPTQNPALLELGRKVLTMAQGTSLPPLAPNQRFDMTMFAFLMSGDARDGVANISQNLKAYCGTQSCHSACKSLADEWLASPLKSFTNPHELYAPEHRSFLLASEERLAECFATLSPATRWTPELSLQQAVARSTTRGLFRSPAEFESRRFANGKEMLDDLSQVYGLRYKAWKDLIDQADRAHLGWYTNEQEADDFALEMVAAMGFPPESVLRENWMLFQDANPYLEARALASVDRVFTFQQCQALAARNWKGPNGELVYVPVGEWSDIHHSMCFRIFNIAREIQGHHYVRQSLRMPPGGSWEDIVASTRPR